MTLMTTSVYLMHASKRVAGPEKLLLFFFVHQLKILQHAVEPLVLELCLCQYVSFDNIAAVHRALLACTPGCPRLALVGLHCLPLTAPPIPRSPQTAAGCPARLPKPPRFHMRRCCRPCSRVDQKHGRDWTQEAVILTGLLVHKKTNSALWRMSANCLSFTEALRTLRHGVLTSCFTVVSMLTWHSLCHTLPYEEYVVTC